MCCAAGSPGGLHALVAFNNALACTCAFTFPREQGVLDFDLAASLTQLLGVGEEAVQDFAAALERAAAYSMSPDGQEQALRVTAFVASAERNLDKMEDQYMPDGGSQGGESKDSLAGQVMILTAPMLDAAVCSASLSQAAVPRLFVCASTFAMECALVLVFPRERPKSRAQRRRRSRRRPRWQPTWRRRRAQRQGAICWRAGLLMPPRRPRMRRIRVPGLRARHRPFSSHTLAIRGKGDGAE